jgi:hypothetical protein
MIEVPPISRRLRSKYVDDRAWMLSSELHTRIGEQDLLLPCTGHIVFATVAGQGWLAGPKPSLDASRDVAGEGSGINPRNLLVHANLVRLG